MELAEQECPWGPSAANDRMLYLAQSLAAASQGYDESTRKRAQSWAGKLWRRLCGPGG